MQKFITTLKETKKAPYLSFSELPIGVIFYYKNHTDPQHNIAGPFVKLNNNPEDNVINLYSQCITYFLSVCSGVIFYIPEEVIFNDFKEQYKDI